MLIVSDLPGMSDDLLEAVATHFLEGVTLYNRALLRSRPFPALYESGVRFRNEPWAGVLQTPNGPRKGFEQLCHAGTALARGWADCAQLCAWRKAELDNTGRPSTFEFSFRPVTMPDGSELRVIHVMLKRDNEFVEDPSRYLL